MFVRCPISPLMFTAYRRWWSHTVILLGAAIGEHSGVSFISRVYITDVIAYHKRPVRLTDGEHLHHILTGREAGSSRPTASFIELNCLVKETGARGGMT